MFFKSVSMVGIKWWFLRHEMKKGRNTQEKSEYYKQEQKQNVFMSALLNTLIMCSVVSDFENPKSFT